MRNPFTGPWDRGFPGRYYKAVRFLKWFGVKPPKEGPVSLAFKIFEGLTKEQPDKLIAWRAKDRLNPDQGGKRE